jgi:zinc protease
MFGWGDGFCERMTAHLFAAVIGLAVPAAFAKESSAVQEFVLENGLKLIVKQDHRAPVVVSQVWYKVGSGYEHGGITGISHMLEHMMFKGTDDLEPGEFSRIIAEQGGTENAFTSYDYTAYFQELEKSRLEVSFELEADRMRDLELAPDALTLEKQVVMEERRLRTDDDPQSLTLEHFRAVAFKNSPYRNPVLGWMTDIKNYELDDLQSWYRRWYAPNNAVVVVVGDVEPAHVRALADKHFGELAAVQLDEIKPQREVPQVGPQRITVQRPARLPYLLLGYPVPSLATAEVDWEPYALIVLAAIFDGNEGARFGKNLRRGRQLAAQLMTDYGLYDRKSTLFVIAGYPTPGTDVEVLEAAVRQEIVRVQRDLVTGEELDRIRTQVVAEDVYARDSLFYQAMQLGQLEAVGLGWQRRDEFIDRIKSVTAKQVQAVANKYLLDQALTVAVLEPDFMEGQEGAPNSKELHVH